MFKSPPPAAVSLEQKSIQPFRLEEAQGMQRNKRKLLSSSARQTRKDEKLSFDVIESSAMIVEDSTKVKTTQTVTLRRRVPRMLQDQGKML